MSEVRTGKELSKLYPYNPDYISNPKILNGVIKDQGKAIGNLNAKIKELEGCIAASRSMVESYQADNAKLEAIIKLGHDNFSIWMKANTKHIIMGDKQFQEFHEILKTLEENDG